MDKHIAEAEAENTTREFWGKRNLVLPVHGRNSTAAKMQVVHLFLKYTNIHVFTDDLWVL